MNEDFPNNRWIEFIIGVLSEDGTITFISFPKLRVRIILPESFPDPDQRNSWSWRPQEGCIVGDWKSGDEIRFSMIRTNFGWDGPSLFNPKSSSKQVLEPCYARVEGWDETFKEHRFEAANFNK